VGDKIVSGIYGVLLTPMKIIDTPGGNVLHGIKQSDTGYEGFGEAYFSKIETGAVKGWKRHHQMILNIVVPVGTVRFIIYDDRFESPTYQSFQEVTLSTENYQRLTVPSMLWVAFQGVGESDSMLFNLASIPHNPNEVDCKLINEINFSWLVK
jgi:dTDP-4-dehydrorhamnose 3,5-epimerase